MANASAAAVHGTCTVGEVILRALQRYPNRLALQHENRCLTYAELTDRVGRCTRALAAHGLGPGNALSLLALNRIETVTVFLAAQVLGLRYTPLHPLGSEADHTFILEDAEIDCLVVDELAFAERGRRLASAFPLPNGTLTLGPADFGVDLGSAADAQTPGPPQLNARVEHPPYLMYTGGTTGRPKGVLHSHGSWIANALNLLGEGGYAHELRFLAAAPLSHAAGTHLLPIFLHGGSVHLLSRFKPDAFLAAVQEQRITQTFLPPTAIYALLDEPHLGEYDVSSLSAVLYGASPMAPTRLAQAMDVFGPVFAQGYGQTEALTLVTRLYSHEHDPRRPERLLSCGRPIGGVLVRLLDPDLREVPQGEVGEICIRAPTVMTGYWKRPEETAEAIRGGWLHTGDLARADAEGFLYIVDRLKDLIVSGGFNVYPREVEDVLTTHPGVAAATVIGVPDERWGEAVKAVVVRAKDAALDQDELIALVRERKGSVNAPKSVDFVEELPLTAIGKPDKKRLRSAYWPADGRQVG